MSLPTNLDLIEYKLQNSGEISLEEERLLDKEIEDRRRRIEKTFFGIATIFAIVLVTGTLTGIYKILGASALIAIALIILFLKRSHIQQ